MFDEPAGENDDVDDEVDEGCWVSKDENLSNCTLSTLPAKSYLGHKTR
jgi:hypothetical protein